MNCSGGKESNLVIQRAANDLDQIKRSSSAYHSSANHRTLCVLSGNELRERIHKWLAPPDPSTNHNIACSTHHKKMATWFFRGRIYQEWKSTGSLLWIHGKRSSRSTVPLPTLFRLIVSCNCSWIWKKCSLVRRFFTVYFRSD